MHKKSLIGGLFLLLTVYGFSSVSFGFDYETRRRIVDDALTFCPYELRTYLERHKRIVSQEMSFVDRARVKLGPADFEKMFAGLVERIKSGGSNEYNTIRKFGILACCLSESIYPGHVGGSMRNTIVRYDGFHEVGDLKAKLFALAEEYRPYKGDRRKEVTDFLYNIAVNETADLWTSAWKASGQDVTKLCRTGLEIQHNPSQHASRRPSTHVPRKLSRQEILRAEARRELAQEEAEKAKAEQRRLARITAEIQKEREEAFIRKLQMLNLVKQLNARKQPVTDRPVIHHHYEQQRPSFDYNNWWHQQEVESQLRNINRELQQQRMDRLMRQGW